jgi:hypothetical protein
MVVDKTRNEAVVPISTCHANPCHASQVERRCYDARHPCAKEYGRQAALYYVTDTSMEILVSAHTEMARNSTDAEIGLPP